MSAKHNPQKEQQQLDETPERFFRDIEIEFLIHELKDPLAVIETGLRTVLNKREKFGPLTSRQEKTLNRVLRNSMKAREMLHGLLEVGRSEAGCFICCRFKPAQAAYGALLDALEMNAANFLDQFGENDSQKDVLGVLSEKGISVDISPGAAEAEMHQDELKFRQIVGNLIKNAMHHRKKRVEIRMNREGDQLLLDVTDDGPGVDPGDREMIFRRYAQGDACALIPRSGHGLGLAGARILARCLGGDIELESKKGKGATFRVRLPLSLDLGAQ
jgi:signal transduction histidine kinase